MTPIRPNLPPAPPPAATRPAQAARLAAQKAFFEIAAGQAPITPPPITLAPVTARPATPPQRVPPAAPQQAGEAPRQPLRPGSLLDIRV